MVFLDLNECGGAVFKDTRICRAAAENTSGESFFGPLKRKSRVPISD
jgi:hypothetical protein